MTYLQFARTSGGVQYKVSLKTRKVHILTFYLADSACMFSDFSGRGAGEQFLRFSVFIFYLQSCFPHDVYIRYR